MNQPEQGPVPPLKVEEVLKASFSESVTSELAKQDLAQLDHLCHEISLVACSVRKDTL